MKSQWCFIFTTKERASDFISDFFFYFRSWGTIMVQHCILITVLYCSQLVLGTPLDLLALQNSNENQEVCVIVLMHHTYDGLIKISQELPFPGFKPFFSRFKPAIQLLISRFLIFRSGPDFQIWVSNLIFTSYFNSSLTYLLVIADC